MEFTLREVFMIGGTLVYVGGMFALVYVHGKNITALWKQKQDTNVCDATHKHIAEDIIEIKGDVKELLRRNGGE